MCKERYANEKGTRQIQKLVRQELLPRDTQAHVMYNLPRTKSMSESFLFLPQVSQMPCPRDVPNE